MLLVNGRRDARIESAAGSRERWRFVNAANGRSFVSEKLFPERVLTGSWPRTFRLALLEKDVGIARGLTEDLDLEAPVIRLVSDLLREGREALGDEVDHVEWIKLYEQRAGVELRG